MSENFDLTILALKEEKKKLRTKRPIDKRLPSFDSGVCVLLIAPPRQGKSVNIANLLLNSQFAKGYWDNVYLIGGTIKNDKSLRALTRLYESTTYDYLNDSLINQIIEYQLQFDESERPNCCIVIDDAIALSGFDKRNSALTRLSSNYRHVLGGNDGGGMLLISSQKLTSIPVTIRSCANVILIGRTTNISQRAKITDEWGDSFGGAEYFNYMLNKTFETKYSFLCLYIDGNDIYNTPCAYKNYTELLYPNPKIKEDYKTSFEDIQKLNNNNEEKII